MYRTQYDPPVRVVANPGSGVKQLYSPVVSSGGVVDLEEAGKEDLYAYIQSHKDSVDIHLIMQRCASGDVSALSKVQGVYGDFVNVPKTYAELLNTMIKGEQYFFSLPVEVRAQFDHSFERWLSTAGSPEWLKLMGADTPTPSTTENQPSANAQVPPGADSPSSAGGDDN